MADNEIDEPLAEGEGSEVEGEEGSGSKKWRISISKPTLIKIGIGLGILLLGAGIGVGTYLLISPEEELPEPVTAEAVEEDALLEEDLEETVNEGVIELPDMSLDSPEETADADMEETVSMPDGVQPIPEVPVDNNKDMSDTQATTDLEQRTAKSVEEQQRASKVKEVSPNRYIMDYQDQIGRYSWTPEPKREPAPEPKWGEFDRLNSKK